MTSRTTLWRRVTEAGLSAYPYSDISDSDLNSVMEVLVKNFPRNGIVMMWGQLKSMGIVVTRRRVHDSLLQVSPHGVATRRGTSIQRCVYSVPSPNFLWHIDGIT